MAGKLIIFSAPSGAGKSTLVHYLLQRGLGLEFSISATSRALRGSEKNGIDYFFLSPDDFRQKIVNQEFVEYEEVYKDCYYGTLRSEIERITGNGKHVIFDVDVKGGLSLKKKFGDDALALFIAPPSIQELLNRLNHRGTDSPEMIEKRIAKADYEMSFASQFDIIVVNDVLERAQNEAEKVIREFLV
jgi:guanylate kinase